jgi:hypothetical protein
MNYLWDEFNIKTFPAETIVFCDGIFQEKISTTNSLNIDKNYELPVHIIYVGEIKNENDLHINISTDNQLVFLTVKIENKNPAFLNIFIKNAGKNSEFKANILLNNYSDLNLFEKATHMAENSIILKSRLIAHKNSKTLLTGFAKINKDIKNCDSDIGFSVMADPTAKIEFSPAQYISSIPNTANHSASLYKAKQIQIEYLKESGLLQTEIDKILEEAFINNNLSF